jgi:hypothetical protein
MIVLIMTGDKIHLLKINLEYTDSLRTALKLRNICKNICRGLIVVVLPNSDVEWLPCDVRQIGIAKESIYHILREYASYVI